MFSGDLGGGAAGVRVTSGIFQAWMAAGVSSTDQLFTISWAFLAFALLSLAAGWWHHHCAVPQAIWFNDVDAILTHHLTAVLGCGSIGWAGHLAH